MQRDNDRRTAESEQYNLLADDRAVETSEAPDGHSDSLLLFEYGALSGRELHDGATSALADVHH